MKERPFLSLGGRNDDRTFIQDIRVKEKPCWKYTGLLTFLIVHTVIATAVAFVGYLLYCSAPSLNGIFMILLLVLLYLAFLGRCLFEKFSKWWDSIGTNGDF